MNGNINFREFRTSDIDMFKKWLYEDHVARWYEHPENWLEEVEDKKQEYTWVYHFIVEYDNVPFGFCQYYEYKLGGETWHEDIDIDGVYSIDYMIGNKDYLGRGYGKQIILSLIEMISEHDNAKLIIVKPDAENMASRGTLVSAGFTYDEKREYYRIDL